MTDKEDRKNVSCCAGFCCNDFLEQLKIAKTEAYKEFAKKLKIKITQIPQYRFSLLNIKWEIDNLLKELVDDSQ